MPNPETSLRKEPKQKRSQILVEAVTEAATRILPRVGVGGATTNRIAEVAGVSIGSLYQYFPTKESILARAIESDLEKREGAFREIVKQQEGNSLDEVIGALSRQTVDTFFDDAAMLRLLFAQAPALDRIETIVTHRETVAEIFLDVIDARTSLQDRESLRLDMLFLLHAVMGTIQAALMSEQLPDRAALAERVRDLITGYLRQRIAWND